MVRTRSAGLVALLLAVTTFAPAHADEAADKAAIAQRLRQWTAAFNSRDVVGVCDLFAPDLLYSIPQTVQGTQQTMCGNLARLLARTDIQVSYGNPDIHEIIVSGDIAVVRLTWTLTAEAKGTRETTTEEGMDVFRRQAAGRWSIARFVAFTTRPNALLR